MIPWRCWKLSRGDRQMRGGGGLTQHSGSHVSETSLALMENAGVGQANGAEARAVSSLRDQIRVLRMGVKARARIKIIKIRSVHLAFAWMADRRWDLEGGQSRDQRVALELESGRGLATRRSSCTLPRRRAEAQLQSKGARPGGGYSSCVVAARGLPQSRVHRRLQWTSGRFVGALSSGSFRRMPSSSGGKLVVVSRRSAQSLVSVAPGEDGEREACPRNRAS